MKDRRSRLNEGKVRRVQEVKMSDLRNHVVVPFAMFVEGRERRHRIAATLRERKLLSVARQIVNNHLVDTQTMLRELQREARR